MIDRLLELRRRSALLAALSILAVLALAFVACGDDEANPAAQAQPDAQAQSEPQGQAEAQVSAYPLTLTDSSGTDLTFEAAPQRIISYSPGATEILFAIGAGEAVVAADEFSNYPAETEALPKLTYSNPDPEAALAHEPDLVIMASNQREQVGAFRGLEMRVFFLEEASSLPGVLDTIRMMGRLTGHEEEANALAGSMQERIDAVQAQVAEVENGPRVFYELTPDLYTVAPDTFIGDMLSRLKAQNIAAGAESAFPQLSAEAVIDADPEVVLLADAAFGESLETVAARPGWGAVAAVASERVIGIDPDLASRPGPRIVDALELIAQALYPDRFD